MAAPPRRSPRPPPAARRGSSGRAGRRAQGRRRTPGATAWPRPTAPPRPAGRPRRPVVGRVAARRRRPPRGDLLDQVADIEVLQEHLVRIDRGVCTDPAGAVSAFKTRLRRAPAAGGECKLAAIRVQADRDRVISAPLTCRFALRQHPTPPPRGSGEKPAPQLSKAGATADSGGPGFRRTSPTPSVLRPPGLTSHCCYLGALGIKSCVTGSQSPKLNVLSDPTERTDASVFKRQLEHMKGGPARVAQTAARRGPSTGSHSAVRVSAITPFAEKGSFRTRAVTWVFLSARNRSRAPGASPAP